MNEPKVVVLGLDGAPWDLLEPWSRAGALPNIATLISGGYRGRLRSTLPFVTPLAWPSIYTGVEPGRHGILGFRKRLPHTYDWVLHTSGDLARPTFWEIASQHGVRSGIFFAPFTYPAQPFDGLMVTGAFGPRRLQSSSTHPSDLAAKLRDRFSEDRMFALRQAPGSPLREVALRMAQGVEEQTDAMIYALKEAPMDLAFVVWHDTDRAAHLLWHHSDLPHPDTESQLFRVYRAVDDSIGRLLNELGGDPLVVMCSDHGTYPIVRRVNAHLWLKDRRFLQMKKSAKIAATTTATSAWRRAPGLIKKVVPISARKKLQHRVRKNVVKQNALIEWSATRAYPQPISPEAFFLNRVGREPEGTVNDSEYARVIRELSDELRTLTFPDGAPLVEAVHEGDELFAGEHREIAPDLVAEPTLGTMFAPTGVGETEIFSVPERPDMELGQPASVGYHQRDGIYLFSGASTKVGQGPDAGVCDIAPTLLRYLDVPMPDDLDGHAIEDAFEALPKPRIGSTQPFGRASTGLTEEEEIEVSRNLQQLGYLE